MFCQLLLAVSSCIYQQLIACTLKLSQAPQAVRKWIHVKHTLNWYSCILRAIKELIIKMVFYIILVESDVYNSTSTQERLYADMKYPSNFVMTSIVVDGRLLSQLVFT